MGGLNTKHGEMDQSARKDLRGLLRFSSDGCRDYWTLFHCDR